MTLTAVGASVWASGSQVWNGHTGSFMAKAATKNQNTTLIGMMALAAFTPFSESSTILKVPTLEPAIGVRNTATMATSMKALPAMVKMRNFIAEYSFAAGTPDRYEQEHRQQL